LGSWNERDTLIIDIARSPIGRANKGSLIDVRPDDLAAQVVAALMARNPEVPADSVDDLICGASGGAGEQAFNIGRAVGLLAGLPDTVPAVTVNRFCASSLQAARMAHHAIGAGEGDVFVVAGVESSTRRGVPGTEEHHNPRFTDATRDDYVAELYISMGETAERIAERYGVTREDQDAFAERSHGLALAARDCGATAKEIVGIELPDGSVAEVDDGPRRDTSLEKLARLRPVFRPDGTVTAGNACPLNDGAASMIVTSGARATALGLSPIAKVRSTAVSGLEPELMGLGPIEASRRALAAAGMKPGDLDAVEINEAFSAQVLPSVEQIGLDLDAQVNLHGGAIALGHPFGMTGVRLLSTLLNVLAVRGGGTGMVTLCIGGGQGMAMVLERV